MTISSKHMTTQAKILLHKLSQLSNDYTKEAVIADHLDILMAMAHRDGYEVTPMGYSGVTSKLYDEGVLK